MSIVVNVNGESINYPQTGDTNWGDEATDFAVQTSSALAKVGLSTGTTVEIAGTLGISNGTALSPAITPSGDTNTGLYSVGADKIGFAANGVRQGEFGVGYGGFTGNIIQVVGGELTTRATTASSSFGDTGLSASITPFYSNSKILILFSGSFSTDTAAARFNLVRNSTNIAQGTGGSINSTGIYYNYTVYGYDYALSQTTVNFLDSPSTTSAITYKIQFASGSNGVNIAMNGRLVANDYVGISTLILLEVQQ